MVKNLNYVSFSVVVINLVGKSFRLVYIASYSQTANQHINHVLGDYQAYKLKECEHCNNPRKHSTALFLNNLQQNLYNDCNLIECTQI